MSKLGHIKTSVLIIAIALLSTNLLAQKTLVVLQADNKAAVANADVNIYCNNKLVAVNTNKSGGVQLPDFILPSCKIVIEAAGFETYYNYTISNNPQDTIYIIRKNIQLNEFVVTGVAKDIIAEKNLYKVNVISAATIKQQAVNNVAELLSNQTSFYKQQDNLLGTTINMQGLGGQNIKILINGVPLNGRENGNIDLSQININNVERVEIVKGPMSVLYGSDALGGVINIITKQPQKKFGASLNTYAESIGRVVNSGSINFTAKGRHAAIFNVARTFNYGVGFADTFNRATIWKPKQTYNIDADYTYKFSKGKISYRPLVVLEKIQNLGTPKIDPFSAFVMDEYYYTTRVVNTIGTDVELDSNKKLMASITNSYYNRVRKRMAKDMTNLTEELSTNPGDQDTSTFIDNNFRSVYHSKNGKQFLFYIGAEVNTQQALSLKLKDKKYFMYDYAIFAAPTFNTPNGKWSIQPSLRIATNNYYKVPITPSLLIKAQLTPTLLWRISYTTGYRAPSLKELYLNFVDAQHNVIGNAELNAETSYQIQTHTEKTWYNKNNALYKNTLSIYGNQVRNQIALALVNAASNAYQYANVDYFQNIAVEYKTDLQYKDFKSVATVAYNNIMSADSGRGFANWELNLNANYALTKYNSNFNVQYRYLGKQAILGIGSIGANAMYTSYLPATYWLDANASKKFFNQKLFVQLGVKNILNIQAMNVRGNINNNIHSNNGNQLLSPGRSGFISMGYTF